VEMHVRMRQGADGRWIAAAGDAPKLSASGATQERCLANFRRALQRGLGRRAETTEPALVVEVLPLLAGVAEAAEIMGWDKRRVITYIDRGRFPEPVQSLASGRVWLRDDVQRFAKEWHARQATRRRGR
jgi:hypothetical protein